MKTAVKRILSMILVCVLSISLLAFPVYAVGGSGWGSDSGTRDTDSRDDWTAAIGSIPVDVINIAHSFVPSINTAQDYFWNSMDYLVSTYGEVDYPTLRERLKLLNDTFNGTVDSASGFWPFMKSFAAEQKASFFCNNLGLPYPLNFVIEEWGTSGYMRIKETQKAVLMSAGPTKNRPQSTRTVNQPR